MGRTVRWSVSFIAVCFLTTCTARQPDTVRVRFSVSPKKNRMLYQTAAEYPCFGLLITGEGIPSITGESGRTVTDFCSYPGASSRFIAGGSAGQMEVYVPAGRNRRIQVVGLETGSSATCFDGKVSEFLQGAKTGSSSTSSFGGVYELGVVVRDLLADTSIDLNSAYDPATAKNIVGCQTGVPGLSLIPRGPTKIDKGGKVIFKAEGGTPPYTYTAVNGAINSSTGYFLAAGTAGVTSTITVTDSTGATSVSEITTYSPPILPYVWYVGGHYVTLNDGTALTGTDYWNSKVGGTILTPTGTGTMTFRQNAINGFSAIQIQGDSNLHTSSPDFTSVAMGHAYMVAKVNAASQGTLFCLQGYSGICDTPYNAFRMYVTNAVFGGQYADVDVAGATVATPNQYSINELIGEGTAGTVALTAGANTNTGTTGGNPITFGNSPSGYFFIGPTTAPTTYDVSVAELLVFTSVLTTAERANMRAYLMAKYRIP